MIPDAECLLIMSTVLSELKVGKFKIKINNRKVIKIKLKNENKIKKIEN